MSGGSGSGESGAHRPQVGTPLLSRLTLIEAAITALICLAGSLIVFGPLLGSLSGPLGGGDLFSVYVTTTTINPFGLSVTQHFGYPEGMDLRYFPGLDVVPGLSAQIVNALSGSAFLGVNLVLLLSGSATGVVAYLSLRLVRLSGPVAISLATAFALIPFHWDRGLGHVYLATMTSAALAVALALLIGGGWMPGILSRGPQRSLRISILVVAIVVVAWSGIYFACFALLIGLAAWLWRVSHGDDRRELLAAGVPLVGVATLVVLGLLPAIVQQRLHPPATPIAERLASESATYAGNLLMAILPAPLEGVPGTGGYREWATTLFASIPANEATGLGNYGTWITTACLVVFGIGGIVLYRRARARHESRPCVTWSLIATLIVVTIAFFIPWGANMLVASTVSAQIRAWNRLLPILLLLFIVGAGLVLAQARWSRQPIVAGAIAGAILLVTAISAVLPYRDLYAGTARNAGALADQARDYAAQVNDAIPGRCGILQLPYVPFPEAGLTPPALPDYDHFVTAALNPDKDFSYGAVKQTPAADLASSISTPITPGDVQRLRERGFCGIHLDLRGYEPGPLAETQVMLQALLGDPIANGREGAWLTYALDGQGK